MIALSYLSAIRFSELDAGNFLHNQLSADVLGLSDGESTFACYCEPKGRVLALMLVCRVEQDYFVLMSRLLAPIVIQRLKIYVMRSKVKIEEMSELSVLVPEQNDTRQLLQDKPVVIPIPASNQSFSLSTESTSAYTNEPLQNAWKQSELRMGVTWLCPETSGQFLPQMLGFDQLGAVNFRKGCYPGQEIVARTHYLGKVKRHPRLLETREEICPVLMEQVRVLGDGQSHQAIIVDTGHGEDGSVSLMVVTRMQPELKADSIEYLDQTFILI